MITEAGFLLCKLGHGKHRFINRTYHDNRYDGMVDECYYCGYERRVRYPLGARPPKQTITSGVPFSER